MDKNNATQKPKKTNKRIPLLLGLLLLISGGTGSFMSMNYFSKSGGGSKEQVREDIAIAATEVQSVAFVPMHPMTVSLGPNATAKHLRFTAQIEVPAEHKDYVESMLPRVVDTLNGYLQAVDESDITGPASLLRLRSQMLRRAKLILGNEKVNDLLVMEFILN
ncbi:flagellar basal body-associated FliL family protein [Pseudoprimorskyibacter insulae]|uniref:Flagellar protein FliL n=1 Tax=Pseudoprimorskyibacter insulae TaxID=1695997 RepID=A0A2R8AYJ2_9RHOB|nr:flagellar basal body-associated FliL family protein [Pseudoprimorskyibacter insulae]SPF81105.1 hypothetical protein PRI8871_02923 [Pseudoprimorskyibacter insulae]